MSKDSNDVLNTGTKLLKDLEKEDKDIKVFSETDPMYHLRKDILSFFQTIMATVSSKESLKKQIEDTFIEDLESGELSIQDRMSLYKLISTQTNISAESIMSIFKPTPGAPSLLAENISRDREEDYLDKMYESLKPNDLQKIDKLMKALELITDKDGNK